MGVNIFFGLLKKMIKKKISVKNKICSIDKHDVHYRLCLRQFDCKSYIEYINKRHLVLDI